MQKLSLPFRNDNNQRYSKQLFFELWRELPTELRLGLPPFTLDLNKDGYVNFGKEYIEDEDPTGYTTSVRLLGEYGYWKHLEKAGWFREAVERWNEEMDARIKARALRKIVELSTGDDAKALQAAKFLANAEYKNDKKTLKRGRPSKEEIAGKLAQDAEDEKTLQEDAARIRLVK